MENPVISFGHKTLGGGHPVFVVAELANAHGGDFHLATRMVRAAADCGADAVKVQLIRADSLVVAAHPRHAHFRRLEFSADQWAELFDLARACGLPVLADVFDPAAVDLVQKLGAAGLKIHGSDTCNAALIRRAGESRLPLLLSTGGAAEHEVASAIDTARDAGAPSIILLHGYQAYPTDPGDLHLRRLHTLRERFGLPVGLQDHLDGSSRMAPLVPLLALSSNLVLVEKHLTLDRTAHGLDYYSALEPGEFRMMVGLIREGELMLGRAELCLSAQELAYRMQVRKVVVPVRSVPAGATLQHLDLTGKRAPSGLTLELLPAIAGRRARRDLRADMPLTADDVEWNVVVLIAVRMHSTRLPGKALLPLAGRPAIEHLIDRLRRARIPKRVVLCTSTHPDDRVLLSVAERAGIAHVAGSEDDVMARFLLAAEREQAEHIVRVTGDDLFVDPEYLDRLVLHHLTSGADYSCMPGLPKGTECEVISVPALQKAHRLAEDSSWSEYMTWYLNVPDVFRVRAMPIEEEVRRPSYRLTLDYPEDLEVVRRMFALLGPAGSAMSVGEIVQCLDAHPDIARLNATVPTKPLPPNLNVKLSTEAVHV